MLLKLLWDAVVVVLPETLPVTLPPMTPGTPADTPPPTDHPDVVDVDVPRDDPWVWATDVV